MTKAPTRTEPRAADCLEGAPHPRTSAQLFGQARAQAAFLGALASGRLHHNWLLCGPRGIGNAAEQRFEDFGYEFQRRVRQGYLELAAQYAHRFCVIDANRPEDTIADAIADTIAQDVLTAAQQGAKQDALL